MPIVMVIGRAKARMHESTKARRLEEFENPVRDKILVEKELNLINNPVGM